eukprot:4704575-Amphidinium_carterae.1
MENDDHYRTFWSSSRGASSRTQAHLHPCTRAGLALEASSAFGQTTSVGLLAGRTTLAFLL